VVASNVVELGEYHRQCNTEASDGEAGDGDGQQVVPVVERDSCCDTSNCVERYDYDVDKILLSFHYNLLWFVPSQPQLAGYGDST